MTHRFVLRKTDESYPDALRADAGTAGELYGVGDPSALTPGVAVIGARDATPYGLRASAMVAEWAASAGVTVYSGAARGCDQAAHRAALAAGGKTVAVLGCGPDVVYPASAGKLLTEIARDGAVVSPFTWGTPPARYRFPVRNRIIAALASLIVVTEAKVPSGTFSTVRYAAELDTDVAAVPGSIFSRFADAPNRLIADGATVITRCEDLLSALDRLSLHVVGEVAVPGPPPEGEAKAHDDPPLDRRIMLALAAQPLSVVGLAGALRADPTIVARTIERMAVNGRITRFADGTYMALGQHACATLFPHG